MKHAKPPPFVCLAKWGWTPPRSGSIRLNFLAASASVSPLLARAVAFISLYDRLVPFLSAQFSPANTLFYLLFSISMLSLSVLMAHTARSRRS